MIQIYDDSQYMMIQNFLPERPGFVFQWSKHGREDFP